MQLIADRFVSDDRGGTIDLASGEPVQLIWSAPAGVPDHARWVERCDWFASLRHPLLARLLDFGPFGESRRFEAWRMRRHRVDASTAAALAKRANAFLNAEGRSPLDRRALAIGLDGDRLVGVPDPGAGFPGPTPDCLRPDTRDAPHVLGLLAAADPRVLALSELFSSPPPSRLVAFSVWGVPGSGATEAAAWLARAAREAGTIPVSAPLLTGRHEQLVAGRPLLIVCTGDPRVGWLALLRSTLAAPLPHVLLFAGAHAVPGVPAVAVRHTTWELLVSSVRPGGLAPVVARRVAVLARRARGLPGRFEQLLWSADPHAGGAYGTTSRAAEHGVAYGSATAPPPVRPAPMVAAPGPRPESDGRSRGGALPRLRSDLLHAQSLLATGRHARGTREARQAIAALARRGDWAHCTQGAILLARTLRHRGEIGSADGVLRDARSWAASLQDPSALNTVALLAGQLLTDAGRLVEAQRALEAVLAASRSLSPLGWHAAARALARCQFWQGQFDDASRTLPTCEADGASDGDRVSASALRARIAIGLDRLDDAIGEAARAREEARRLGRPEARASAAYATALAQLAAGDLRHADAAAAEAVSAARLAGRHSLACCVRLLRAEIARRQGAMRPGTLLIARFARVPGSRVPFVVRARLELLRDLLAGMSPPEAAHRRAASTGLKALSLLVPRDRRARPPSAVDAITDVLRLCQESDDDAAVLASVCALLRARLGATAVAFFVEDDGQCALVASDGGRVSSSTAARVHAAGQCLPPHAGGDRPEAGVPVRFAGRTLGVLVAHWAPLAQYRGEDVALLLSTAAAAAGPALGGLVARRRAAVVAQRSDLIGLSAAMAQVRAAVDSAAVAPFPVLIEGESGSGKELVARQLHRRSPRRDRAWCSLNCAALPEDLVESELFGHARGAFTGAMGERRGVFEEAHGGTLFLDEIGELSLRAQAKLLRAVQEGEVRRVGENVHRRVDVRLIAATNRDLRAEVAAGRFRMDLLYRLDVVRIAVPPLRHRLEDIELLAAHFWQDCCARIGSRATLTAATLAALARYDWPGNVRELQNVLAAVAVRVPRRGAVPPSALPPHLSAAAPRVLRLAVARQRFDLGFVRAALARAGGNRTLAAEELGISRQGLAKLMSRLRIADVAPSAPGA